MEEIKKIKKITKIAIWDFDGTLVDTPLPEVGKVTFETKTGKKWPHIGWWGQTDSLDMDIFDMPLINSVKEDYEVLRNDESIYKVMLTGRRDIMSTKVEEILKSHDLEFDEYHYNTGGKTETVKMRIMSMLISKFPNTQMILWDDRLEHIPLFEEHLQTKVDEGKLKEFKINVVPANRH